MKKQIIDLGIAWDWEYDKQFMELLEESCRAQNISTYLVHSYNIEEVTNRVRDRQQGFKIFLDRASDTNSRFNLFTQYLRRNGTFNINNKKASLIAEDKAILHLQFLENNINVPATIILNSHKEEPELSVQNLEILKKPFVAKPAKGGGGEGVWKNVESWGDIGRIRLEHQGDRYLLQEKVNPLILNGKKGWIRSYYVWDNIFYCWWDESTHIYTCVTQEDEEQYAFFRDIKSITRKIAKIVELNFFSTELVLTKEKKIVSIDYVNDPCDMRLKSIHPTGVPDNLVKKIADKIVFSAIKKIKGK